MPESLGVIIITFVVVLAITWPMFRSHTAHREVQQAQIDGLTHIIKAQEKQLQLLREILQKLDKA